jgi:hypothetical protein
MALPAARRILRVLRIGVPAVDELDVPLLVNGDVQRLPHLAVVRIEARCAHPFDGDVEGAELVQQREPSSLASDS